MIFLTGKENMDETIEIKVTSEMAGKRLDVVLSEHVPILSIPASAISHFSLTRVFSVPVWDYPALFSRLLFSIQRTYFSDSSI